MTEERTNLADAIAAFGTLELSLRSAGVSEPPGLQDLRAALARLFEYSPELHQWVYLNALRAALAGAPGLALLAVDNPQGCIGSDGWLEHWLRSRPAYDRWEDDPEVREHNTPALRIAEEFRTGESRRTLGDRWRAWPEGSLTLAEISDLIARAGGPTICLESGRRPTGKESTPVLLAALLKTWRRHIETIETELETALLNARQPAGFGVELLIAATDADLDARTEPDDEPDHDPDHDPELDD